MEPNSYMTNGRPQSNTIETFPCLTLAPSKNELLIMYDLALKGFPNKNNASTGKQNYNQKTSTANEKTRNC